MQPETPKSSTNEAPQKPRRKRWPILLTIGFFALIVIGGAGFVTATALEEHDTFCISCHTVPETNYYNRAYISLDNLTDAVPDLATAHYQLSKLHGKPDFACIDCHRGDSSLGQRISTLALGGRDAVIYVLGREDPTIEKTQTAEGWLPNAACTTCHSDTLLTLKGLDNHFHTHLPQAAAALANGGKLVVPDSVAADRRNLLLNTGLKTVPSSIACTDCHAAHQTMTNGAASFFIDTTRRNKTCVMCHVAAKEGPQDVNSLQG